MHCTRGYFAGVCILLSTLFFCRVSKAQNSKIDSLNSILNSTTDTKIRVDLLNEMAIMLVSKNDSLSLQYTDKAIEEADKIQYNFGLGTAYRYKGQVDLYGGRYPKARKLYKISKKYYELDNNKEKISALINDIGLTHLNTGEYEEALKYFKESIKIDIILKDTAALSTSYINIASIHNRKSREEESIAYVEKALVLDSLVKKWDFYAQDLSNLANMYKKIGQHDKALEYAIRGYTFATEINDYPSIYIHTQVIGDIYRFYGNYESSNEYLEKSLEYAKKIGNNQLIGNAFTVIALTLKEEKKLEEVIVNLDSALIYASPINRARVLNNISQIYESEINNLDSALHYGNLAYQNAFSRSDSVQMISPLFNIGFILDRKGEDAAAMTAIEKGLDLRNKFGAQHKADNDGLDRRIADILFKNNDYKRAYEFLSQELVAQDSVLEIQESAQKQLLTYEKEIRQFKIRNQEEEIKESNAKLKGRFFVIMGFVLLSLFLIIFGYVLYGKNKKLNAANLKLDSLNKDISETNVQLRYLSNEIHHRAKNDFQSISSMIFVQQNGILDKEVKNVLMGVRDRVLAMGQIHMLFYKEGNYFKMGLAKYLQDLVKKRTTILSNQYTDVEVDIKIDIESDIEQKVSFDEAKQLGIVVNELITNMFKHAFVDSQSPSIVFKAYIENNSKLIIKLVDNGVGIDVESIYKNENSFGLKMIKATCKQLGWQLGMQNVIQGSEFSIQINT